MKKHTLQEHSKNYTSHIEPYQEFKKAEDSTGIILSYLKEKIKGKIVLDLGCGDGTYAKKLAPLSKCYYGIDSSREILNKAKDTCKNIHNIHFLHTSGEKIDLPTESIDIIISSWVISVVKGRRKKSKILIEAERLLTPKGEIILIENDSQGEFEEIRQHPKRTKKFNEWLVYKGFNISKRVNTYFEFPSYVIAKQTFEHIWGSRVSNKITNKHINHKILIFTKFK